MKMVFISKKRETLLFFITNLLVKVKRSFKPYQRLEKRVGEKNGAQKVSSARPANSFLVTF